VSLSSLKITSRTLFKVKIQNKIRCAQFGKIKGMTWQKCVFRRRLKVPSVSNVATLDGKVFQTHGTATKNARSPIVTQPSHGPIPAGLAQRRLKDRELNQARSKPDPVNQPVRTARTIVHHYNTTTQYCSTETVLLIFDFLQTNITSEMWPSEGNMGAHHQNYT